MSRGYTIEAARKARWTIEEAREALHEMFATSRDIGEGVPDFEAILTTMEQAFPGIDEADLAAVVGNTSTH